MQKILTRPNSLLLQRSSLSSYVYFKRFSSLHKPRGTDKAPYSLKTGDNIHGFKVTKTEDVPLYSMKAFMLEHNNTKAKYLHLHTLDSNNCFAVGFKTTPSDNRGASHILEKLVLCGSEKYPVRDPFANMVTRSLNTYMNAWTGTDYTCFPFSTYNEKDFKNLMSVYLESVFRPLLTYHDFLNEGWHFEFQREENPDSDLVVNGGVYNQMKSIFQSPDNIFLENLQKNVFNSTPYQFCAGGIPQDIIKLSYEELKELYKKLYHPSNAFFYSYGDLDFTDHLQYLETNFLSHYQAIVPGTEVPLQTRFKIPEEIKIKSPPDPNAMDPERQAQIGIAYLCNDVTQDALTSVALNILSYMLFETPKSPLYQDLLEAGLTTGYCAGYGYDMNTREASFTVGARNLSRDYGEMMKIDSAIEDTLKRVAEKGFSQDFIEAVLHQIEFQAKMPKPDFGITLLQSIIPLLNHGGDPVSLLKINELMGEIRKRIRKTKFFEDLVKKYLIENKHKVRLLMTPDKNLIDDESSKEKRLLKEIQKKLDAEKKEKIQQDLMALKVKEVEIQNVNVLPNLELEDVPRTIPETKFDVSEVMGIPFYFTEQPTNGITSFRIRINLKDIPENHRVYLKFLCQVFPRLGTKTIKAEQMIQLFDLHTYNFELQHVSSNSPFGTGEHEEYLVLSIVCLDHNIEHMFNHLTEILTSPGFKDYTNISQLLKIFSSEASNSLVEDALSYAISYAAGGVRMAHERTEKLKHTRFICDLAARCLKVNQARDILIELERRLEALFGSIFRQDLITFCVHANKDMYEQIQRRIELLCHTLKAERGPAFLKPQNAEATGDNKAPEYEEKLYKTFFPLPMQSNYVVEAFPIPHFTHPDTPKLHVLAEIMSMNVLNEEVKEKGGAYGAGSYISSNGVLCLYSYRDPHLLQTYQAFEQAIQWAASGSFSVDNIKEAKLKIFSQVDQVESPFNKGLKFFLNGITDQMRNEYRLRILDVSKDELVEAANKYLLEKIKEGKTSQVIFGNQNNDLEGLMSRGWKIERPVEGLSVNEGSYDQNVNSIPRLTHDI